MHNDEHLSSPSTSLMSVGDRAIRDGGRPVRDGVDALNFRLVNAVWCSAISAAQVQLKLACHIDFQGGHYQTHRNVPWTHSKNTKLHTRLRLDSQRYRC